MFNGNGNNILKNPIVRWTALVLGAGLWLGTLQTTVGDTTDQLNGTIEVVNEIEKAQSQQAIDIEVIKTKVENIEEDVGEIKEGQKEMLRLLRENR